MSVGSIGAGGMLQNVELFGNMQTTKNTEEQQFSSGDSVSISDEAKYLYAEMLQNNAKTEENTAQNIEADLQENSDAMLANSETVGSGQDSAANGDAGAQQGGGGPKGSRPPKGGGSAESEDDDDDDDSVLSTTSSTDTLTSLQSEIDAIEMQIALARQNVAEGESNAQIEALEAELAELEASYDEMA